MHLSEPARLVSNIRRNLITCACLKCAASLARLGQTAARGARLCLANPAGPLLGGAKRPGCTSRRNCRSVRRRLQSVAGPLVNLFSPNMHCTDDAAAIAAASPPPPAFQSSIRRNRRSSPASPALRNSAFLPSEPPPASLSQRPPLAGGVSGGRGLGAAWGQPSPPTAAEGDRANRAFLPAEPPPASPSQRPLLAGVSGGRGLGAAWGPPSPPTAAEGDRASPSLSGAPAQPPLSASASGSGVPTRT